MTAVDTRVRIVTLLAQQQPEALKGMTESEWVDFKSAGPSGPYDLSQESKKYELAKDVAAFANAGGGLLVCGFKATRRPTDLHETVVKLTPFEKRLVNTERYKAVIADLVRPSISVDFHWHPDPVDPGLGYLLIDVHALPESDRWAVVTKTLNDDGKLTKGGVAIPKRHGDDTHYLPPDEVYRLVNNGLRGSPAMDVDLTVDSGAALDVTVAETVVETLVERRRRELLSSLPETEQRPRRQREGSRVLSGSEQQAIEQIVRLQDIARNTVPYMLRELRSPRQYREEVDSYLEECRSGILQMLNRAVALQRSPLTLRLNNCSDAMLELVQVTATLDPGYRAIVRIPDTVPDLSTLPWPEPPEPYGSRTPAASMGLSAGIVSLGLPAARRGVPVSRLPEWTWSENGLVIEFPPVDLRAHAQVLLDPVLLYGQPSADGAAAVRWTATCTNLNGRQAKEIRIPVDQLSVTLPPDTDTPELTID
jgi:hypothetical protein